MIAQLLLLILNLDVRSHTRLAVEELKRNVIGC